MLPWWMERNWKNTSHRQDLSSHFHFEETGDSDEAADSDPIIGATVDDDDDAQSCSYDGSAEDTCNSVEYDDDDDEDEEKKLENEDEKVVVYGTSYCEEEDDDDEMNEDHKSFDSGQLESVDEMERNRMFWEACLAS